MARLEDEDVPRTRLQPAGSQSGRATAAEAAIRRSQGRPGLIARQSLPLCRLGPGSSLLAAMHHSCSIAASEREAAGSAELQV